MQGSAREAQQLMWPLAALACDPLQRPLPSCRSRALPVQMCDHPASAQCGQHASGALLLHGSTVNAAILRGAPCDASGARPQTTERCALGRLAPCMPRRPRQGQPPLLKGACGRMWDATALLR